MKTASHKPYLISAIALIGALLITAPHFSGRAEAGTPWWQKGTDLLKTFVPVAKQKELTVDEIGGGLKEALRVGTENVVRQLGIADGFNSDPVVHIPLPEKLQQVKSVLAKVKMSGLTDDLELKLNRAAEDATPKAKKLFWQAITEMKLEDVKAIYNGPDDAATRYFQDKMSTPLAVEMQPVVEKSLSAVGAVQAYDNVIGKYRSLPFVPDVKADLTGHVVKKGIEGIFYYLAREEAAIRQNPAKQTTDILKRVFGAKQ